MTIESPFFRGEIMREISVRLIKDTVRRLFYDANHILPNSLAEKIKEQEKIESNEINLT